MHELAIGARGFGGSSSEISSRWRAAADRNDYHGCSDLGMNRPRGSAGVNRAQSDDNLRYHILYKQLRVNLGHLMWRAAEDSRIVGNDMPLNGSFGKHAGFDALVL
jgi:hypothetical protein